MTKAGKFLSKQAQLQPHYYSKTRQLSTQLENSLLMRKNKNVQVERKTGGSRVQRRRRSSFNSHDTEQSNWRRAFKIVPTLLPSLTITLTKAVSSLPVLTIISVVAFNFMVQEP